VKAAACTDPEASYQAVHRGRYLRNWTDTSGAFRLDASLTPDAGAEIMAALAPVAKKLARRHRRQGRRERREALAADALLELCRGTDAEGNTRRPRVNINIRVDATAWERGTTKSGEMCEIDGTGPIPVSVAQALAEGEINTVGMDGGEVVSLVSRSRYIPANVRRALIARDPMCVIPGCYQRDDLQFHHWPMDFVKSRRTSLDDLARACAFHHDLITRGHFKLRGGPGKWEFLPVMLLERARSDPSSARR